MGKGVRPSDGLYHLYGSVSLATYSAYCIMTERAGYTLTMKLNGSSNAFAFDSAHWTTPSVLNSNPVSMIHSDAKYSSFNSIAFGEIMFMLYHADGRSRNVTFAASGSSLLAYFTSRFDSTINLPLSLWSTFLENVPTNCYIAGANLVQLGTNVVDKVRLGSMASTGACNNRAFVAGIGMNKENANGVFFTSYVPLHSMLLVSDGFVAYCLYLPNLQFFLLSARILQW